MMNQIPEGLYLYLTKCNRTSIDIYRIYLNGKVSKMMYKFELNNYMRGATIMNDKSIPIEYLAAAYTFVCPINEMELYLL